MMINCEKASQLTSKELDAKLSFFEKISLRFHTKMCKTCLMFSIESSTISEAIKRHQHSDGSDCKISEESKNKMQHLIDSKVKCKDS